MKKFVWVVILVSLSVFFWINREQFKLPEPEKKVKKAKVQLSKKAEKEKVAKVAKKPSLPPKGIFVPQEPLDVDLDTVLGSRDLIIYRAVTSPVQSARLINGKYSKIITEASEKYGVPEYILEGMIFIEQGSSISSQGARGVMQIIPTTAVGLGVEPSALSNHETCIMTGARYLAQLFKYYGRWDFAVFAYHSGMGNVNKLIRLWMSGLYTDLGSMKENIRAYDISYEKIFFGCSPTRNPKTYQFLFLMKSPVKDFGAWYYWNVLAASKQMSLYKHNPKRFRLKTFYWKHTGDRRRFELVSEVVWYPPKMDGYQNVHKIISAYKKGEIVKAPKNHERTFGFTLCTDEIGIKAAPDYRQYFYGSRPETIGLLIQIAYLTRQASQKWNEPLAITSLIRSDAYQGKLTSTAHSVHTLGYAVDFSRLQYKSEAQKKGFQYALDTLKERGHICYAKEGNYAIHVALNPRVAGEYRQIYKEAMSFLKNK